MQHRTALALGFILTTATACPGGTTAPSITESAACPAPVTCPAAPAPAACPAPVTGPAAPACPAPAACPAPVACAAPVECPAPAACPAAPVYPELPTTISADDPWPVPIDDPHGLDRFCEVEIATVQHPDHKSLERVGCGDVNDPRFHHALVTYTQQQVTINADGTVVYADAGRGCYGPHGDVAAVPCKVGDPCGVTAYIYGAPSNAITTATGKCVAP